VICDYSLEQIASRPAAAGQQLISYAISFFDARFWWHVLHHSRVVPWERPRFQRECALCPLIGNKSDRGGVLRNVRRSYLKRKSGS
jgi:hypothetical protein